MFFVYNNISMYYEKHGNGKKTILILPGWGNTRITFNYLIDKLKEYFTIYIVDYPGWGNSPFPNKDLTIYDYADLIHEFTIELNINDPILIGHSFGGRIITILSGYYQYNFSNIILIDSAGIKHKHFFKNFKYKLLKKISVILPKKRKKKYLYYLFNKYSSSDYKNLSENMRNTFKNIVNCDLKYYFKKIRSRVLIIWGKKDNTTPLKDGLIMNKLIPNSELIIMDNCDHFPYLNNPILFTNIIYEQIKEEIIN